MKLSIITNYKRKGYINEQLIFKRLCSTLNISINDIFDFNTTNVFYKINKNYTHVLVIMDYNVTSPKIYKDILKELLIPKIFIIDSLHYKKREIHESIFDTQFPFTSLSHPQQNYIYNQYADGFVFYNKLDQNNFNNFYTFSKPKPSVVIPPSLGKKIEINFKNFNPNKLIGINFNPSAAEGILNLKRVMNNLKDYYLDIYGSHGREDIMGEYIINDLTFNCYNINFKGKLMSNTHFFNTYHIYYNATLYDSFNYFAFLSLLNGMVPILTSNTGTHSFFPDYPFTSDGTPESIEYNINLISKTPPDYLKKILTNTLKNLIPLNDKILKEKYNTFLNEF
tara:strand:- start:1109 stop:2122 length:1014 start_codon:yes stop_codon:yes gene_type:complete